MASLLQLISRRDPGSKCWLPQNYLRTFFSPKTQQKPVHCSCVPLSWCRVTSLPPVSISPGCGPKLSRLLAEVLVMQVANALHAEHHLPVCVLLCRLVNDLAFCISLICRAYAFTFSGDWRDLILLSSYPTPPGETYLAGRSWYMWYRPTMRGLRAEQGVPEEEPGIFHSLFVFTSR